MAGKVWPEQGYWAITIRALDEGADIVKRQADLLAASKHTKNAERLREGLMAINDVRMALVLDQHDQDRKAK